MLPVHSRLCPGCSLTAAYGRNAFIVSYPPLLAALYPDHVTNVTLYGRMLNTETIINVNPSLFHNEQVCVLCSHRDVFYRLQFFT